MLPRRPCRVASTSLHCSLMMGFCAGSAPALRHILSALVRGSRLLGSEVNLGKIEVISACSSSVFRTPAIFLVAPGLDPPLSNFSALHLGRRSRVRICLAWEFLRMGPSWARSASFLTHKESSVSFAFARIGPRFSFLVALSLLMPISGVSALPTVMFARLSFVCVGVPSRTMTGAWRLLALRLVVCVRGVPRLPRFVRPLLDGL